jgi:hypothetical protein
MPLDIQAGGVGAKLRRLMGVRGRLPLRLDEQLVPVTEVGPNLGAPFRTAGDAFEVSTWHSQAAVAAQFPFVGIWLPLTSSGALRVWQVLLQTTGTADTFGLWIGNTTDYIASQSLPANDIVIVENYPAVSAAGVTPFVLGGNVKGTNVAQGIGKRISTHRLALDASLMVPVNVTLRPGWTLAAWRGTVNTVCEATFFATYYPSPDLSAS